MNVPSMTALAVLFAINSPTAASGAPVATTIHIKDFKYHPDTIEIHVGERVTFVNDDDEAHTVTATDASFDSAGMDGQETWQHVFTKVGTFAYFCQLHPSMKATIVVLPAAGSAR